MRVRKFFLGIAAAAMFAAPASADGLFWKTSLPKEPQAFSAIPGSAADMQRKRSQKKLSVFYCYTPQGSCLVPGYSIPGAWCCCFNVFGQCVGGMAG